MRNERDFAETSCAFVRVNELQEHFLAARSAGLDNAAFMKSHLDALDHGSLMRERLRRCDGAFGAAAVWRGEDFFGGHVGDAVVAVSGGGAAAEPEMIVGESEAKIGARTFVVERGVTLFVHSGSTLLQAGIMCSPGGDGVCRIDAGGGKDGIP